MPFEDWPAENFLLALAVIAFVAIVLIFVVYWLVTSPDVQNRLHGLRSKLARVGRQGAGAKSAGDGALPADGLESSFNREAFKARLSDVEQRVDRCERYLHALVSKGEGEKNKGGGIVEYQELRRNFYILLQNEPEKVRELLGLEPELKPAARAPEPPARRPALTPRAEEFRKEQAVTRRGSEGGASARRGEHRELCGFYNSALNDQLARSDFKSRAVTISVVNAKERRRDGALPAEFQTASDGNFLAVSLDNGNQYAVFPKFNLVLGEASYGPGAIGEVFKCPDFDPRFNYPNIRVEAPAIFVDKGGVWEKMDDGVLTLGEPQKD